MKIIYSILFIATSALISVTLFFIFDCKLYYYGESKYNFCKKKLPLELSPDYWDSHVAYPIKGFTLTDKFGFVLFQKGSRITSDQDTIEIHEIIEYSFNEDTLTITCIDTYGIQYLIECNKIIEKEYNNELWIKISKSNSTSFQPNFKRVVLKNNQEEIDLYEQLREGSVIGFILITIVFLFGTYIMNKRRTYCEK
jgi:hypothetical protein